MSLIIRLITILFGAVARIFYQNKARNKEYLKIYSKIIGNAFQNNPKALDKLLKGITLYNKPDYKGAVNVFESLIKGCVSNREFSVTYFFLALCFDDMSLNDEAIKAYGNATNYNNNFATAWSNRGIIHKKRGEFDEAIQCFDKAIELDKTHNFAYSNKASVYLALLEYDKAIEYASIAIDIAPNMHQAHQILALAYAGKKDKETAEKYYQKCIINGTKSSKEIRNMMDNLYAGDDTVISE